jgi:DNA-binding NtrC family response regulator
MSAAPAVPTAPVALIVEEDPELRRLASALLEESALDVIACESAEAALSVMQRRNGRVVLVFADVDLAGLIDGVDLARLVTMRWPGTKVIVTGASRARADRLPRDTAYVQKPWRGLDVLIAAEQVLPVPGIRRH